MDFVNPTQFHPPFPQKETRTERGERTFQGQQPDYHPEVCSQVRKLPHKSVRRTFQLCKFLPTELCSSTMSNSSLGNQSPRTQQSTFRWLTQSVQAYTFFYFKPNHLIKELEHFFSPATSFSELQLLIQVNY